MADASTPRDRAVWHHPLVPFVAIAAVFVVVRVVAVWGRTPLLFPDTLTYRPPPEGLPYRLISFTGDAPRAWVLPLFYRLLTTDTLRMFGQVVVSIAAWIALAAVVASAMRRRAVAIGAFVAILLIGWSPPVVFWDVTLLAESLTLSLAVCALAAWLRFATRPGWWPAAFAVLFTGLWVLSRPFQYPVSVALAVVCLLWAWRPGQRGVKVAAAMGLLVVTAWSLVMSPRINDGYRNRDGYDVSYFSEAFGQNFYRRYLPDPRAAAWFAARGMPSAEGLPPPAAEQPPDANDYASWLVFFEALRARPDWLTWLDQDAQGLVLRYAAAHPGQTLRDFVHDAPYMLRSATNAGYGPLVDPLPDPLDRAFFWGSRSSWPADWALWTFAVVILGVVAAVRRARPDLRVVTVGALTVVGSLGLLFQVWLGSAYEIVRHSVPGAMLLRVGLVILVGALLDALLARQPRTPIPVPVASERPATPMSEPPSAAPHTP